MRLRATGLTALSLALAGCGPSAPSLLDARVADAGPVLTLDGCENLGAVFPVPAAVARTALPAGFEPLPASGDPAGGSTLYVLALRCSGSSVDGVDTGAAQLAYAELAVTPPAEYAVEGLADYTVPLVFAAMPEAVGAALAQYRLGDAGPGSVQWTDLSPAGGVQVEVTLGNTAFTLSGALVPANAAALSSGDFALFGVQGGEVQQTVLGHSAGGEALQGALQLDVTRGPEALMQARPVARGFSVQGFSLRFETPAP